MSEVKFDALTPEDAEQIRIWRNQDIAAARTPYLLTKEMQERWYYDVVCDRKADSRYWAIKHDCGDLPEQGGCWHLSGIAGLQHIEWENSTAEISLMIGPDYRRKGYGKAALEKLLDIGFPQLNLHSIWGEVYKCTDAYGFWEKMSDNSGKYSGIGNRAYLPDRKYWEGKYHDALWFCFMRGA